MDIAIIASGPSLHPDDIARIQQSGIYTIAVNSSWVLAPFCDVIFACDTSWWVSHAADITIKAERWCQVDQAKAYKTRTFRGWSGWNSGANAILFALQHKKATRILMLGFDCSLKHGIHAHGPHTKNKNPQAKDILKWHFHFGMAAGMAKQAGVPLLNCSRYTEITSIQRVPLVEALHGRRADIQD